jgi:hypothetical protein
MSLAGKDTGEMRLPLCEANEATKVAIRQQMEKFSAGTT